MPWRFALAIVIGRGIRYFGQESLAVLYGESGRIVKQHGATVGIALAILALIAGAVYFWFRRSGLPAEPRG